MSKTLALLGCILSLTVSILQAHPESLTCAVSRHHPDEEHDEEEELLLRYWSQERQRRTLQSSSQIIEITVPVCFHVIRPTNDDRSDDFLDATHLQIQLDALNRGFSDASCCKSTEAWCEDGTLCSPGTGFTFEMAQIDSDSLWDPDAGTNPSTTVGSPCITRTIDDELYNAPFGSIRMKQKQFELRRGDATVLNVYYTDIIDAFGTRELVGGVAQFPFEYGEMPKLDGIFVSERTALPRNRGDPEPPTVHTIVHETGHWLGVYHPFGSTTGCSSDGDFVDDTPVQKVASFTCDPQRDTCPNEPGFDSVHNYMDYSRDICSFSFTPGQRFRMEAFMALVRLLHTDRPIVDLAVSAGTTFVAPPVDLGPFEVQYYRLQLDQPSRVSCSDGGSNTLRMRKGVPPEMSFDLYDCTTATRESDGLCNLFYAENEVYALVRASGRSNDGFVLRCTAIPWEDNVVPLTLESSQQVTIQGQMVLFRLEEIPPDSVISCTAESTGDLEMVIEFDYEIDIFEQVTPTQQCRTDGSTCTQELLAGQTAMNVALSRPSDVTVALDATLTCTSTPKTPILRLENGISSSTSNLAARGLQYYEMEVGRNGTEVQCVASATTRDGHLFLNWGIQPITTAQSVECRTETLETPCKARYFGIAGIYYPVTTLYVGVEATLDIENLQVTCTKLEKPIERIENATMVGPMPLLSRTDRIFELKVSPGSVVDCTCDASATSEGELDMYFRLDMPFDVTFKSQANCTSETSLSQESCRLDIPIDSDSSLLYITLLPYDGDVDDAILVCTVRDLESTTEIVTTAPSSSAIDSTTLAPVVSTPAPFTAETIVTDAPISRPLPKVTMEPSIASPALASFSPLEETTSQPSSSGGSAEPANSAATFATTYKRILFLACSSLVLHTLNESL